METTTCKCPQCGKHFKKSELENGKMPLHNVRGQELGKLNKCPETESTPEEL